MASEEYSFEAEFQTVFIPKQKHAPNPIPDDMIAIVVSYPPLGQVTQVRIGNLDFSVVLDVHESRGHEPWQVAMWHSIDDGEWIETSLRRTDVDKAPISLQANQSDLTRHSFELTCAFRKSMQFTFKVRSGSSEPWRWIRAEQGLGDGVVVVNGRSDHSDSPESLQDIIKDLNPAWKVLSIMSQAPATKLWSLSASVKAADKDESTFTDIPLGTPWGNFLRWFALVRIWTPWLAPRHGHSKFELDKDAILCSFLNPEGRHLVLLAISGANNVLSVFRHNHSGGVTVQARSDSTSSELTTILVAVGNSFESANAAVMYQARNVVTAASQLTKEREDELVALRDDVKAEWMENWYDGLGFCTWNALGQRLTDKKVFDALDKLAESDVRVTNLIIDDNWQNIDYRGEGQFQHGWNEFEAEPKAFPQGLKATVARIRAKHPQISHVAVWHALLGYWGGISPDGKIAKTYKTVQVRREDANRRNLPLGGKMTIVGKEDVDKFYDDFYRFLADCGIDGVKTDAQFMTDTWVKPGPRRDLTNAYLDAWTISSLRHFNSKVISCMSHTPPIIFYSQLPRNRPTILCRNSDDFFPQIPASHPWHVWANAHNSLLTQHLNILPDWDMFQTVHDYSSFHAAARCVSGGPIYITDVPGEHNIDLINQMTGTTTLGKRVIFRPSVVGKAIDPYLGYDDDGLLKVGSYHGAAVTGTPILGVFNISARTLTELIPLSSFPGVLPSLSYVVRAHSTGRVLPPTRINSTQARLSVRLEVRGYEIFTVYPLFSFESELNGPIAVANLGLLGKMTGAAAILANHVSMEENGRIFVDTTLKALGTLGDFMATIQGRAIPPETVSVSEIDECVLQIDVATAWKEMDLQPGWSNEVQVKVFFNANH